MNSDRHFNFSSFLDKWEEVLDLDQWSREAGQSAYDEINRHLFCNHELVRRSARIQDFNEEQVFYETRSQATGPFPHQEGERLGSVYVWETKNY